MNLTFIHVLPGVAPSVVSVASGNNSAPNNYGSMHFFGGVCWPAFGESFSVETRTSSDGVATNIKDREEPFPATDGHQTSTHGLEVAFV